MLHRLCFSPRCRFCSEMQGCVVLCFMARSSFNRRPLAATYLCRFAEKARFDNRHPPPEGVSKEGGPQPSLFGRFKERGFLRGEGNRNPSPLKWRFWLLLSLLTKVTRRRQKRARKATEWLLSQHLLYFALPINPNTAGLQHLRRHAVLLGQRPGKRAVIDAPAPAGRASLLQHRRRAAI